jgi:hypothetical protein
VADPPTAENNIIGVTPLAASPPWEGTRRSAAPRAESDVVRLKSRMEDVFAWFFRDTADATAAAILWLLVISVGVAFAVGAIVFPHAKEVRSDVITLGGGVLVVLTAYFTARRLADGDAQRRTEQLARALELLQSDKPKLGPASRAYSTPCSMSAIRRSPQDGDATNSLPDTSNLPSARHSDSRTCP